MTRYLAEVVLVAVLTFGSVALVRGGDITMVHGKLLRIAGNSVTVQQKDGTVVSLRMDRETVLVSRDSTVSEVRSLMPFSRVSVMMQDGRAVVVRVEEVPK